MKRTLVLLCVLGLLAGCRTPAPTRPLSPEDPRPARLLERLRERGAARQALRARTRLQIDAPDLKFNRPQRMAVSRPSHLRVEIIGLFGQVAAVLVTDGETYEFYDARQSNFERGPVTESLLWQVARVDLEPAEATRLLLGTPEPGGKYRLADARVLSGGKVGFELQDSRGRVRERYLFDRGERLLQTERLDEEGRLLWRAGFGDYRRIPGSQGETGEFAHLVELKFPRVRGRVELTFKEVALVPRLPTELFDLEEPNSRTSASGGLGP